MRRTNLSFFSRLHIKPKTFRRSFSDLGKIQKSLDDENDIFNQTGDSYKGYSRQEEQARAKHLSQQQSRGVFIDPNKEKEDTLDNILDFSDILEEAESDSDEDGEFEEEELSDEYDEEEEKMFQEEEKEKAIRTEIADSIFEDDYRTEALNRHRLKRRFASEAHKIAKLHNDAYQINATLSTTIQEILLDNEWPKGFGKEKKEFEFAERLFTGSKIHYDRYESLQYLANEFPLSLACIYKVLHEVAQRLPKFRPGSMLDFGSGPATAFWAARDVWSTLNLVVNVEESPTMIECGKTLTSEITSPNIQFIPKLDHGVVRHRQKALVTACFVLSEITSIEERTKLIDELWNSTFDVLVLIEAGSMDGFNIIHDARAQLLRKYGPHSDNPQCYTVAPCSHDGSCPLKAKFKCTFSSRIFRHGLPSKSSLAYDKVRSKASSKASRMPNETWMDFAYVVLRKGISPREGGQLPEEPHAMLTKTKASIAAFNWPRIVAPIVRTKDQIAIRICRSKDQGVPGHKIRHDAPQRVNATTGLPQIATVQQWKLKKADTKVDGSYYQARRSKKGDLWQWEDNLYKRKEKENQESMLRSEQRSDIKAKIATLKKLVEKELK